MSWCRWTASEDRLLREFFGKIRAAEIASKLPGRKPQAITDRAGRLGIARLAGKNRTVCPQGHPYTPENTYRGTAGHRFCIACYRERIWRSMGISDFTFADYQALFVLQNGRCAICMREIFATGVGRKRSFRQAAHVDHDKNTGAVRGLLCRDCNTGLGLLGDTAHTVALAATYLHKAEAQRREVA